MANAETPVSIRQEIVTLTDETFDRVQVQVDRYAQDERRTRDEGGVILSSHTSAFYDSENHFGFMDIKICNFASRQAAALILVNSIELPRELHSPENAHAVFVKEISDEGKQRVLSWAFNLQVKRARYPQGHTDYGWSRGDMWGEADYDPNVWGQRHKVGAEFNVVAADEEDRLTKWSLAVILQNRFDRPNPQRRITSELTVYGTPAEEEATPTKPEPNEQQYDSDVTPEDILVMRGVLDAAKDIRPKVDPIRQHVSYRRFMEGLWSHFTKPVEEVAA